MWRRLLTFSLLTTWLASSSLAADLSIANVTLPPGTTTNVVVSGGVAAEATFGVTILVELVPRAGAIGTVEFTTATGPGNVDVMQVGDPWPGAGTFTPLDTDSSGSTLLNGSVDDNGTFVAGAVTFTGALTQFPVVASVGAVGVWDILLSTSAGSSSWEGLATTLTSGTVTVFQGECTIDANCNDLIGCTDDTCVAATCIFTPNNLNCASDGVFCNGPEICNATLDCVSSGDPCSVGTFCNEALSVCDACIIDTDCNDNVACTDDTCVAGSCVFTPNDLNCPDNGLFCDGLESCDAVQNCVSSGTPCLAGEVCDEASGTCTGCTLDVECDDGNPCTDNICNVGSCTNPNNIAPCDDGLFCTLTDVCSAGSCVGSGDACLGQVCDEALNVCVGPFAAMNVVDLLVDPGSLGNLIIAGRIGGFDTFQVNVFVELVPRGSTTGTVVFTPAPPTDIAQLDDAWPGVGTFSPFDTDTTGSSLVNGAIDDSGTFVPTPVAFDGQLAAFPVVASAGAGGVWDVLLSTVAGNSSWEGVVTTLTAGTITINPGVSLFVPSFAMPPGGTTDVVVGGEVQNKNTFGETILLELIPRAGAVGTLTFTASPPEDIRQIGDPWPGVGTFTVFDSDATGSTALNGSVDDNGSFIPGAVNFLGDLSAFPVVASANAAGVWDVTLTTTTGTSSWEALNTVLIDGTITVVVGACILDSDCEDGNSCTADVCNAGVCERSTIVGACDDGDLCTNFDTCFGTTCLGTAINCSALDDTCNIGTCNATNGLCVATPTNETGVCDDADLCTLTDVCVAGTCTGTAVDCTSLNDACNLGTCDTLTGGCNAVPINEAGVCDDTDPCTSADVCTSGVCAGTTIVGCQNCLLAVDCDDANACTLETCVGGVCQSSNLSGACDDGDPCTQTDTCSIGVCAGTPIVGCVNCTLDVDCDDLNSCTGDVCVGGACQNNNLTIPCDDGNLCTTADTCSGGACMGTGVNCSSLNSACTVGVCISATGVCSASPINDGLACDDGFPCTTVDTCNGGVCSGTLGTPATVNLVWVPAIQSVPVGARAFVDLVAVSSSCVDVRVGSIEAVMNWDITALALLGDTNTSPFAWAASGFPDDSGLDGLNAPFTGVPGNDGDALFQAVADFQVGATIPPAGLVITTLEFFAFDGSLGATVNIVPTAGSFSASRVLSAGAIFGTDVTGTLGTASIQVVECTVDANCDDGNGCTDNTCVNGICVHPNNTAPCEDGLFCTSGDTCGGGTCISGTDPCVLPQLCSENLNACVACLVDIDCDDGNFCTDDTCDALGQCVITNNFRQCDDGLFCTAIDICFGGACIGGNDACPGAVCDEPNGRCVECLGNLDCDDANVCTDDTCVANVCVHASNTLPCDDGLFCTVVDTCSGSVCVGATDPCVAPALCSEATNSCVQCLVAADCDDGNPCTTNGCLAGTCTTMNNSNSCNDGLFCLSGDSCIGGVCVGITDSCPGQLCDETGNACVDCFTVADCPDDAVACTVDTCAAGLCLHTPDDTACNDGLFCTGVETCNAVLGCVVPGSPCDDPALCNELNNSCGCRDPIVVASGSRYLAITPRVGNTPVALRVRGVDADVACIDMFVQQSGRLGVNPVFLSPRGPGGWGTVQVHSSDVLPEHTYLVSAQCETGQGPGESVVVVDTTWRWADVDNSGGLVDVIDLSLAVEGFRGNFSSVTLQGADIWGASATECTPENQVSLFDLLFVVDAFSGVPIPCTSSCP